MTIWRINLLLKTQLLPLRLTQDSVPDFPFKATGGATATVGGDGRHWVVANLSMDCSIFWKVHSGMWVFFSKLEAILFFFDWAQSHFWFPRKQWRNWNIVTVSLHHLCFNTTPGFYLVVVFSKWLEGSPTFWGSLSCVTVLVPIVVFLPWVLLRGSYIHIHTTYTQVDSRCCWIGRVRGRVERMDSLSLVLVWRFTFGPLTNFIIGPFGLHV